MAWWMPAAIKGASTIGSYLFNRKNRTPQFRNTTLGRHLQKVSTQGRYSPESRRKIIGGVSSRAGNVAQNRNSTMRGYLASRNMGGSIAGARLLDSPYRDMQRTVGDASQNLEIENERSKQNALDQLASGGMQYDDIRRQEKRQTLGNFVGGLANTGMDLYSGYRGMQAENRAQTLADEQQKMAKETHTQATALNDAQVKEILSGISIKQGEAAASALMDRMILLYQAGRIEEANQLLVDAQRK